MRCTILDGELTQRAEGLDYSQIQTKWSCVVATLGAAVKVFDDKSMHRGIFRYARESISGVQTFGRFIDPGTAFKVRLSYRLIGRLSPSKSVVK